MYVTLLPKNFKGSPASLDDVKLSCIIFGITVGVVIFTAWKALDQTLPMVRRGTALRSTYLWMVWTHLLVNVIVTVLAWLFMDGLIPMGFPILFGLLILWVFQIQLPLQIIINRTSLLLPNRRQVNKLRWTVAIFIGLINITVFCIWIPARLEISQRYIDINDQWDRIEKILFALVDLGLNIYFLYIVKSQLLACGLDKYKPLYNFNVGMVVVSISLDILLIGLLDLPRPYCYIQFHPLAYVSKLHIEVVMTDLIIKIVRHSDGCSNAATYGTSRQDANAKYGISSMATIGGVTSRKPPFGTMSCASNAGAYNTTISDENGAWEYRVGSSLCGIEKTVECEVETRECELTSNDTSNSGTQGRRS